MGAGNREMFKNKVVKEADSFYESHTHTQLHAGIGSTPLLVTQPVTGWLPRDHPTSNTLVNNLELHHKRGERNIAFTS